VGIADKVFKIRDQRSRSWQGQMHFSDRGIAVNDHLSIGRPLTPILHHLISLHSGGILMITCHKHSLC